MNKLPYEYSTNDSLFNNILKYSDKIPELKGIIKELQIRYKILEGIVNLLDKTNSTEEDKLTVYFFRQLSYALNYNTPIDYIIKQSKIMAKNQIKKRKIINE